MPTGTGCRGPWACGTGEAGVNEAVFWGALPAGPGLTKAHALAALTLHVHVSRLGYGRWYWGYFPLKLNELEAHGWRALGRDLRGAGA